MEGKRKARGRIQCHEWHRSDLDRGEQKHQEQVHNCPANLALARGIRDHKGKWSFLKKPGQRIQALHFRN
ncbi:hypothetical protein KFK09_001528 [Dendrobium nobile]|uniref:Uncharacterized protein n=1 Tax=Dendrobium nobile TaxID=94219 RepID=A0A8T3C5D6_DENNO|nr:hypothetical protein KFK09_001528 [Dendrobium nobile]